MLNLVPSEAPISRGLDRKLVSDFKIVLNIMSTRHYVIGMLSLTNIPECLQELGDIYKEIIGDREMAYAFDKTTFLDEILSLLPLFVSPVPREDEIGSWVRLADYVVNLPIFEEYDDEDCILRQIKKYIRKFS